MLELSLTFVCVGLFLFSVYLFNELSKLKNKVKIIMTVLSNGSPTLERRIIESGTQVTFAEQWIDDTLFETESS